MESVLSETLDQAIARLAQGYSVEESLQPFPAVAEQLRALLHVCAALQHLAQAPCPPSATTGLPPAWLIGLALEERDTLQ